MKNVPVWFALLLSISSTFLLTGISAAQDKAASAIEAELVSTWLVTVSGEDRTRTLRISAAKEVGPGTFQLDAVYGWTDGNQTAVKAELIEAAGKRSLLVTTQPGSKISTTQDEGKIFSGTFTSTSGKVKAVTIQRVSADELLQAKSQLEVGPAINLPAANVPASCAGLIGGWTGDWSFGKRWLWVTGIDAHCVAMYSYGPNARASKIHTAEIKDGILSFPCGSSGGTCYFEHHGDELWARYAGSDGVNSTVFQRAIPQAKKQ